VTNLREIKPRGLTSRWLTNSTGPRTNMPNYRLWLHFSRNYPTVKSGETTPRTCAQSVFKTSWNGCSKASLDSPNSGRTDTASVNSTGNHPGSFSMSPTISLASDLDKKGDQTVFTPSKLADIPIRINRAIPDGAILKRVTLKTELTDDASLASLSKRIDNHLNRQRI
jgi:hypothetical protein